MTGFMVWLVITIVALNIFTIGAYTALREQWHWYTLLLLSIGTTAEVIIAIELIKETIQVAQTK